MDYILRIAQSGYWYTVIPVFLFVVYWRLWRYKKVQYWYPRARELKIIGGETYHPYRRIIGVMRASVLLLLAGALLKPQLVDPSSRSNVEGIDIMMALDASGSMQLADFEDDKRSRFDIAKDEALRFITKRHDDALGLVLFGREAVSRCPLTVDKPILKNIVTDMELGVIDPDGTVLATGLVTAINRLKHESAKSKIIIALTDGEPSPIDTDPEVAIEAAQKLGIKIYTVGIGSTKQEHIMVPLHGLVPKPRVNEKLLRHIAQETGGAFFMARNVQDMRDIYTTIDQLEKSEFEVPLYSRSYDVGILLLWGAFLFMLLDVLLTASIWFGV